MNAPETALSVRPASSGVTARQGVAVNTTAAPLTGDTIRHGEGRPAGGRAGIAITGGHNGRPAAGRCLVDDLAAYDRSAANPMGRFDCFAGGVAAAIRRAA